MVDMIKDLSIRLFLQGTADEQINAALIRAIEEPANQELYRKDLLQYFDVDGSFRVVLITTDGLDEMDTVERKKLSYRLQIYLENITHNGSFFYYDGNFVLVMNDVSQKDFDEMGLFRMLYSVKDAALLEEMSRGPLQPLIDYDKKHSSNYLETFELYLKYNGSIQAVAEAMFTHRNTVIYRITNIKKMLHSELDSTEERLIYQIAFYIRNMK